MKDKYNFSGWATKFGVKCSDGRTILKGAFQHQDGQTVPMVWRHGHDSVENVLGHAVLEYRDEGVYAYGTFNDTPSGNHAKALVLHGDITALSIFANELVEKSKNVMHGMIRELSLVLAGANNEAKIDNLVLEHGDGEFTALQDEAVIYSGEKLDVINAQEIKESIIEHASEDDATVGGIFETLSKNQKTAVYAIIAKLLEEQGGEDMSQSADNDDDDNSNENNEETNTEGETMLVHNNIFEGDGVKKPARIQLSKEKLDTIFHDAMDMGSLKQSVLKHAGTYGIDNIDFLFPDVQQIGDPEFVARDMAWVSTVLNGTRKSKFSRIKTLSADITVETARALGYQLGDLKVEEVFALAKRETTPQTIYKKQKLDRDDILDITTMDVVAWLKAEMRVMLNEEIARACLISDGRLISDDYKIDETKIRPIWLDAAFYTYRHQLTAAATVSDLVDSFISCREYYEGSGEPTAFMAPSTLTSMLLLKDGFDRRMYNTVAELAAALRVKDIVEVPLMSGLQVDGTPNYLLKAIIVNLRDYNVGMDRGGEINFFDDFDIDYNQEKYLMETRMSGALVKYRSAVVIEQADA